MKIIAIAQARMGSARLPGKVMLEVKGKPLIGYLLDRLLAAPALDDIVVAIPRKDHGSPLARYVEARKVALYCGGAESDLCERFLGVLAVYPCDAFVRVCGDSPLIDPALLTLCAMNLRVGEGVVSNVGNKLFPRGQAVEGCAVDHYRWICGQCEPEDREHAGFPWLYRQIEAKSLVVDTAEDFARVKAVIEKLPDDHEHYGYTQCMNLAP